MRTKDAANVVDERHTTVTTTEDGEPSAVVWNSEDGDIDVNPSDESLPDGVPSGDGADLDAVEEPTAVQPDNDDVPEAELADEGVKSTWKLLSSEDFPQLSLREILGGDYLIGRILRENIWYILFLMALGVGYITNRYMAQQEIIEEGRLRKELVDRKYFALTQASLLTMRSRQSNIEHQLRQNGDSLLHVANEPPFILRQDE